jgi:hypothetical protein
MIIVVIVAVILSLAVFFAALAWMVRDALRTHLVAVDSRLNRIVAVADAADLQYQMVKGEITRVKAKAEEALSKATELAGDVKMIQRRFGILSGAAATEPDGGQG